MTEAKLTENFKKYFWIPNSFDPSDYKWSEPDPEFKLFVFKWIANGFEYEGDYSNKNWREWEEWGGALIDWLIDNEFHPGNPTFNLLDIYNLDSNLVEY